MRTIHGNRAHFPSLEPVVEASVDVSLRVDRHLVGVLQHLRSKVVIRTKATGNSKAG